MLTVDAANLPLGGDALHFQTGNPSSNPSPILTTTTPVNGHGGYEPFMPLG